jgi:hypothetical protein
MPKTKWLDKYELVDIDKIPTTSAPLANTWAKALYEMPTGKAGRLTIDDYDTAKSVAQTIKGSIRAARQKKWGLDLRVHTKIVAEAGKYAVYFWKEQIP